MPNALSCSVNVVVLEKFPETDDMELDGTGNRADFCFFMCLSRATPLWSLNESNPCNLPFVATAEFSRRY